MVQKELRECRCTCGCTTYHTNFGALCGRCDANLCGARN